MDKLKTIVAVAAFIYIPVATAVIADQQAKINRLEDYHRRMSSWSKIMSRTLLAQYAAHGNLDMDDDLAQDIQAYLIFRDNNLD